MRIAFANWTQRCVGGTETYIGFILPALASQGHSVGLWSEVDAPEERARISLPLGAPSWCASQLGADRSLHEVRAWAPDILFVHGVHDTRLEARLLEVAPAALLAHSYYGTCISGTKANVLPVIQPCQSLFGPACLLRYFPRRCGGLNPLTMLRLYRDQRHRAHLLGSYRKIVTLSEYLRQELVRHGVEAQQVVCVPAYVPAPTEPPVPCAALPPAAWRLLYAGRMESLKGGQVLLQALPRIQAQLNRPVHLTMTGDGPKRLEWQQLAARVCREGAGLSVAFPGWLDRATMASAFRQSHLLAIPSLWPEPFGLIGLEAGGYRVPAAAFAVGGIPEWLSDGVNGHLAPGTLPSANDLGDAVARCLGHPGHYAQLREGAARRARDFADLSRYTRNLLSVLTEAIAVAA